MLTMSTATMLLIVVLWFGISAPLSAVGAYFGSKHGVSHRGTKVTLRGLTHVTSPYLIQFESIKFPDKYHLVLNTFVHGYVLFTFT